MLPPDFAARFVEAKSALGSATPLAIDDVGEEDATVSHGRPGVPRADRRTPACGQAGFGELIDNAVSAQTPWRPLPRHSGQSSAWRPPAARSVTSRAADQMNAERNGKESRATASSDGPTMRPWR